MCEKAELSHTAFVKRHLMLVLKCGSEILGREFSGLIVTSFLTSLQTYFGDSLVVQGFTVTQLFLRRG